MTEQTWTITVTPTIPQSDLHPYDKNVAGHYQYLATSDERALDYFHNEIPIKELDYFEITTTPEHPEPEPEQSQHWIGTVEECINGHVPQTAYHDGTKAEAQAYFEKELARFFGRDNYLVTMQPNPVILWDGYNCK